MAWVYLFIAGIFEVIWAISLKYTNGWTKLVPSIVTGVGMVIGFIFLSMALKTLPIGTAYAVWTGIGTIGTSLYGMIFLNESTNIIRITCILLISIGIVGLKFFDS